MKAHLFLLSIFLPAMLFAQSGRVVDEQNRPLAKATVESRVLGKRVMTDANGNFDFGSSSVGSSAPRVLRNSQNQIRISNHLLHFNNPVEQTIAIELFDVKGSKIQTLCHGVLPVGERTWRIKCRGAALVRVQSSGKQDVLLSVGMGGSQKKDISENRTLRAANNLVTDDTLVCFKYGYSVSRKVVSSASTSIIAQLISLTREYRVFGHGRLI